MEKEIIPTCVDCGTQNCKYKDRTYPDFCPTDNLKEEDRQWALERYDEGRNREIMIASAEVEYEGYCQWTRVQEIMEFARKIGAHRIGIANCCKRLELLYPSAHKLNIQEQDGWYKVELEIKLSV